jgi:signal transduction histidine kinase/CheY-like chemotaxis protein
LDEALWSPVRVPGSWERQGRPSASLAWYRLRVRLAPTLAAGLRSGELRLAVTLGKVDSAYEFYAGGLLLGGLGALPPRPRMEYDRHRTFALPREALDGTSNDLLLALRVWRAPFKATGAAGPVEGPFLLGPAAVLERRAARAEIVQFVLALLFVVVGLFHLSLTLLSSQQRAHYLWFGLLAASTGLYVFLRTQWKYDLGDAFLAFKRAEHVLFFIGPAFMVQFFWLLFERPVPRLLRAYQWLLVGAAVLTLGWPELRFSLALLPWFQAAFGLCAASTFVLLAGAGLRGQPEARSLLLGAGVALAAFLHDTLVDRAYLTTPRLGAFGFSVLLLTMAYTLFRRFARVQADLGALRQDLERRIEERSLAVRQAHQTRALFLAHMSHEIRTPLNGVLGMAQLLMASDLSRDQREHLRTLHESGRLLLALVNDVLDVSRLESGALELERVAFDTQALLDESLHGLATEAHAKGLTFEVAIDPALPRHVFGDPLRLRQTLSNLVANAVKFTERGSVTVRVGVVRDTAAGVEVRFDVEDTGIGIPATVLPRLFEPFSQADVSTTRRFGGTGLGLAICRSLAEKMGGRIGVASAAGRGSLFWFTVLLPRSGAVAPTPPPPTPPEGTLVGVALGARVGDDDATHPAPARAARVPTTAEPTVLVVEDNPVNQRITLAFLERLGYRADLVADGEAAVSACAQRAYATVLMDCHLPGMDGFEATARIRAELGPSTSAPIVALTASTLTTDRERCLRAGMNDFLGKPLDITQVAQVLARWVPRTGAGSAQPGRVGGVAPAETHG